MVEFNFVWKIDKLFVDLLKKLFSGKYYKRWRFFEGFKYKVVLFKVYLKCIDVCNGYLVVNYLYILMIKNKYCEKLILN